jgi:uncharacterized protein YhhL (DUF1145 family)
MNNPLVDPNSPRATDRLHPMIYLALASLAMWLVVAAWAFFSYGGYVELDLGIVSALVFMLIAIPSVLLLIWRSFAPADRSSPGSGQFRDWIFGHFDMRQGRRTSMSAAIEILLPMTAAVLGITAIGIVFDLIAAGAHLA